MLPLDKAKSPAFWENVQKNDCFKSFREELLEKWELYGDETDIPALRYRDFKLFEETGNRSVYQTPFFKRRSILNVSAMLSLIYPDEVKYFERLLDIIFAICDEYRGEIILAKSRGSSRPLYFSFDKNAETNQYSFGLKFKISFSLSTTNFKATDCTRPALKFDFIFLQIIGDIL